MYPFGLYRYATLTPTKFVHPPPPPYFTHLPPPSLSSSPSYTLTSSLVDGIDRICRSYPELQPSFVNQTDILSAYWTTVRRYKMVLVRMRPSLEYHLPILRCHHLELSIQGSLIMFCNLVFQQHLQPLCLLQFFEETPLSLYTVVHPLKPAVYDTRPR